MSESHVIGAKSLKLLLSTLLVGFAALTLFALVDRHRLADLEEVEVEILLPVDDEEAREFVERFERLRSGEIDDE